jgi:hypothetical protein
VSIWVIVVLTCTLTAVMLGFAAWELYVSQRFHQVAMAQCRRASAYNALTVAHYTRTDSGPAKAEVAAAEGAVREAEARLPRRSASTRKYFASKGAA